MTTNAIQSSHIYSTYFAPRGRSRIYTLGMQIAQLYLSPFDQIIGFIGEAGSGKSVLIKGMFPGIELTNDDDGVNVRPLPLLEQEYETGFFTPHTYHLDIRFETGFHQLSELADAVRLAVRRGKRIIIEHFDLIYPLLGVNANLLIGVGEQIDDLQKFDPNSYVNALFADFDMRSDVEILVDENIENIPKDDDLFDMN